MTQSKSTHNPPLASRTHRLGPRRLTKSAKRVKGRPVTAHNSQIEDLEKAIGDTGGRSPSVEDGLDI
jgi:hypothetical protein